MIKLDINKYLTSRTFNLDTITYNNIKVLHMNLNQLKNICKDYGFTTFLSESKSQAKLAKNLKELNMYSIGTAIAPYELIKDFNNNDYHKDILDYLNYNGLDKIIVTVCNNATISCKKNCVIFYSGNPAYIDAKQKAMIKRKHLLLNNPMLFLAMYLRYIELKVNYCIKNNLLLSIRFNISSDIEYENINIVYKNKVNTFSNIANDLIQKTKKTNDKDIILKNYDYTKNFNRIANKNYKFVYSVSDNDINKTKIAINNGLSLAMVFDTKKNKPLPKNYTVNNITFKVIDGDLHDYLPQHKEQCIIGLRFKYKAKDKKDKRLIELNKAILNGFVKIAS
jgi:hypothetical protein